MNSSPYCLQRCTKENDWFCRFQFIYGFSICSDWAHVQNHWTSTGVKTQKTVFCLLSGGTSNEYGSIMVTVK